MNPNPGHRALKLPVAKPSGDNDISFSLDDAEAGTRLGHSTTGRGGTTRGTRRVRHDPPVLNFVFRMFRRR